MQKPFSKELGPVATWAVCVLCYFFGWLLGGLVGALLQTAGLAFLVLAIYDTYKYFKKNKGAK